MRGLSSRYEFLNHQEFRTVPKMEGLLNLINMAILGMGKLPLHKSYPCNLYRCFVPPF